MRHTAYLLLLACLTGATAVAQVTCNAFHVEATQKQGQLTVKLETDLPDAAQIVITASRRFRWEGNDANQSVDYHAKSHPVSELRSGLRIDVSDTIWNEKIERSRAIRKKAGRSLGIERVDPRLQVRVAIATEQESESFGLHNRNLSGQAIRDYDGRKGCVVIRWFTPGEDSEEKEEKEGLQRGGAYVVAGSTPLKSHFDPRGPAAAKTMKKRLYKGDVVVVDRALAHRGTTWYRVAAFQTKGRFVGRGWIDAAELKGVVAADARPKPADGHDEWTWPEGFEPAYRRVTEGDIETDFEAGRRVVAEITLPPGLDEAAFTANVRHALWDAQERWDADGVRLAVREGDAPAAIATGVLAPHGVWADVAKKADPTTLRIAITRP